MWCEIVVIIVGEGKVYCFEKGSVNGSLTELRNLSSEAVDEGVQLY